MMIDDIVSKLNKNESEYNLGTSDFAQTISDAKNGLVDIQLMQRNFSYKDCIVIGNQNVSKGTKGIVLFVSKIKYPCFIPIFFVNNTTIKTNPGEIVYRTQAPINETDYAQTEFVNLRDVLKENGLSEGVHFSFWSNAPYSEQYGTKETIYSITNIIKDWFKFTKGTIKLVAGDISYKSGGEFKPHEGRGHKTGRAIDMYLSNGLELNSNVNQSNKQTIIDLFDIMFDNGVVAILWIPPNFLKSEIENRYKGKIHYAKNHENHFHVSFIGVPY